MGIERLRVPHGSISSWGEFAGVLKSEKWLWVASDLVVVEAAPRHFFCSSWSHLAEGTKYMISTTVPILHKARQMLPIHSFIHTFIHSSTRPSFPLLLLSDTFDVGDLFPF